MPRYDYECNTCGGQQEIERSFGDDTTPICCGASMSRLWSTTPVHFKTGGFYSTGG
jgi:putative FmdB family regulatory protein